MKHLNEPFMAAATRLHPINACLGCDKNYCCKGQKGIDVTQAWIDRIKPKITSQQRARYNRMRTDGLIDCPFNGKDGKCEIYDDRPLACAIHTTLETPEHCDTDNYRESIKMADPGATIMDTIRHETVHFSDQLKMEIGSVRHGILEVFE